MASRIQGVVNISVSFSVTAKWLKALTVYSKQDKLAVDYFDTETAELKNTEMYIEEFKAKLEKDTSYRGLWTVSFTLKEFWVQTIPICTQFCTFCLIRYGNL